MDNGYLYSRLSKIDRTVMKKIIRPLNVPWTISPSISGFKYSGTDLNEYTVTFNSYTYDINFEKQLEKTVLLTFINSLILINVNSDELFKDDDYSWDLVSGAWAPNESIEEWKERSRKEWKERGYSTDPMFYDIIENSQYTFLLKEWGMQHYLLMGSDSFLEIIAKDFKWEYLE